MKERLVVAIIPDIHVGREKKIINPWDWLYYKLLGIPMAEAVVGKMIEERLKKAVRHINSSEVDFVVAIGDITESATAEQFFKAKEILSHLERPFIPMMGNHDVWPYQKKGNRVVWNATGPISKKTFESCFKDWRACFEKVRKQNSWLQNLSFVFKGTKFIVADNNNRRKAPFGLPGQAGWTKLYPESYSWLWQEVFSSQEKKVIIFSHAPLKRNILIALQRKTKKEIINIAGHRHKEMERRSSNLTTIVTPALYHEPKILLIHIDPVKGLKGLEIEYQRI